MALTDNLVSYYKLEGNSTDSVGSNNGTDTSITYSHANGKVLQGAGFGGASKISLGTSSTLNPAALTITAWVKASSFANAYNAVYARTTDADGLKFNLLSVKTDGRIAVYFSGTGGTISSDGPSTTAISTGTWYLLTMTYSTTAGLIIYINAEVDNSVAANGTLATITGTSYIGEDAYYTPRFWNGAIDEVGVWSRVLTPTEITQLYNYGAGLTYPFTSSSFLAFM